jgi:hypothetical protein
MEKYYVIGSSLLVGTLNFIPLAAGQLGPYNGTCWYNNPDPATYMRWVVGTQSFWIFLMASSELVCFVILVSYMLRRQVRLRHCVLSVFEPDNKRRCP